jgi:hypothetical protein
MRAVAAAVLRQQADAADGVGHGPHGRVGPLAAITGGDPRLEEGLQIDQDRVLAGRDQVLVVEIGRLQRVEQGQVGALPLVEAPDGRGRGAPGRRHELGPAVVAAIEHAHRPQRRRGAGRVQPGDEAVEMMIDRERARLVDEPEAAGEPEQQGRPPAAVAVARPALDLDQRADRRLGREGGHDRRPVVAQVGEEGQARRDPLLQADQQQPHQHG